VARAARCDRTRAGPCVASKPGYEARGREKAYSNFPCQSEDRAPPALAAGRASVRAGCGLAGLPREAALTALLSDCRGLPGRPVSDVLPKKEDRSGPDVALPGTRQDPAAYSLTIVSWRGCRSELSGVLGGLGTLAARVGRPAPRTGLRDLSGRSVAAARPGTRANDAPLVDVGRRGRPFRP
jgi:hypothetical protein